MIVEQTTTDLVLHQQIERRAYEIWESEGCPDGCDIDHWLRAEAEVKAANTQVASTSQGRRESKAKAK